MKPFSHIYGSPFKLGPGVHCAKSLLSGESMVGTWFNQTQEYAARRRGEKFDRIKYATQEILVLSPLPCWKHLSEEVRPEAILKQYPFAQPQKTKQPYAPAADSTPF